MHEASMHDAVRCLAHIRIRFSHTQANDHLSGEVRRRQYDVRLTDEEQYGPRSARRAGGMPTNFAGLHSTFPSMKVHAWLW